MSKIKDWICWNFSSSRISFIWNSLCTGYSQVISLTLIFIIRRWMYLNWIIFQIWFLQMTSSNLTQLVRWSTRLPFLLSHFLPFHFGIPFITVSRKNVELVFNLSLFMDFTMSWMSELKFYIIECLRLRSCWN